MLSRWETTKHYGHFDKLWRDTVLPCNTRMCCTLYTCTTGLRTDNASFNYLTSYEHVRWTQKESTRDFIRDIIRDLVSRCHAEDNKCLYPPTSPFPSVFRSSFRKRISLGNPVANVISHMKIYANAVLRATLSSLELSFRFKRSLD